MQNWWSCFPVPYHELFYFYLEQAEDPGGNFFWKSPARSLEGEEQRQRPPPVAETGSCCWGRGLQDASAAPRHEADAGCRNPNIFSGNFMILFAVWKCLRTAPNRFFHEKYPNYKRNLSRLLPSPSVPAPSEREPLAKPKSLTERVRGEKQLSSTTPFREKRFWKNPQIFPEPYKNIFPLKMARVKRRPFKI